MKAVRCILLLLPLLFQLSSALAADAKAGPSALGAQTRATEPRVALIIGNGNYAEASLAHPVNDARAIADTLPRMGFHVTRKENASQKEIYEALLVFGGKLRHEGVGLFYFAGHGIQLKGRNFLIPSGVAIKREDDVPRLAVEVSHVVETMESAKNRLNMIIMDASHDNPLARRIKSGDAGLAQMEAPVGSMIAFAAAPNSVSIDGKGQHSFYAQHLLANLSQPGLKVEEVFQRVRAGVSKDTAGRQIPWESLSLIGDFYFHLSDVSSQLAGKRGDVKKPEVEQLYRKASSGDVAALQELKSLAAAGNPSAQTSLGNMYFAGLGVAQDYVEAVKWYRMAAEQGNAIGQNLLGFMYENGQGVSKNSSEAVKWYRKAAEQGMVDAKRALARLGQ